MKRHAISLLAVLATLVLAVAGFAAPEGKDAKATCTAGVGKPVCCKAYVADHCGYVSCCEMGNAGFFSQSKCEKCVKKAAAAAASACGAQNASACAGKSASACASKSASKSASACGAKKDGAACASHASGACCMEAGGEIGNARFFTAAACTTPSGKSAKKSAGACCGAEKSKK